MSAARAFARTKPIIALKVGKSSEGALAAMSHTGSMTGDDAAFDALFKRAGVIRVGTIGQLFSIAQTLSMQPRPRGKRLAIITNAGGPGVIATDALISMGGELAKLSRGTITELDKVLPASWSKSNPVDLLGDADSCRYKKAVELCLDDDGVVPGLEAREIDAQRHEHAPEAIDRSQRHDLIDRHATQLGARVGKLGT